MRGIMSGLEPMRLKDGGFPDLSGDGQITQKDILIGKGVIKKINVHGLKNNNNLIL